MLLFLNSFAIILLLDLSCRKTKNSRTKGLSISKSLWLLAIVGIMGSFVIGCSGNKGPTQASDESSALAPAVAAKSGNDHWIEQENLPVSYLAVNEETLPKLIEAEASSQPFFEVGNLYKLGRVFDVDKKTGVEILENKGVSIKVRILEGKMKGRIGWIQSEFVKSCHSSFGEYPNQPFFSRHTPSYKYRGESWLTFNISDYHPAS